MRFRRAALGFLVALGVAGCALPPQIHIVNNSGVELRLHIDRRIGNGKWDEKVVVVGPGEGRTLHVAKVVLQPGSLVRVGVGDCEVAYQIPATDWRHEASYSTLVLSLEPDLALSQVLQSTSSNPNRDVVAHPDFPLQPASRACR